MKKRLRLLWVLLFVSLVAVGSTSGFANKVQAAKTTVVVWDWSVHSKDFFQKQFAKFNEGQDEVEVRYVVQPGSRYDLMLKLGFNSGNPPDVFMTQKLVEYVNNGWVRSFDDLTSEGWKGRFPEGAFVPGQTIIKGKLYSFPFFNNKIFNVRPLFINLDIMHKAGFKEPPKTWGQLRLYAQKMTQVMKGNGWGFAIGGKTPGILASNVSQLAVTAGNTDGRGYDYSQGKFRFQDPSIINAYKLLKTIEADGSMMPGLVSMDDETARIQFGLGKIGMMIGGWWNLTSWMGKYDVKFGAFSIPVPDSGRKGYQMALPPVASWCISSQTKNPAAAWKVIDFLSSIPLHQEYVRNGLGFSIFPQSNQEKFLSDESQVQLVKIAENDFVDVPMYDKYEEWMTVTRQPIHPDFDEVLTGVWLGRLPLESSLAELSDKYNAEWERALAEARKKGIRITQKDLAIPGWRSINAK